MKYMKILEFLHVIAEYHTAKFSTPLSQLMPTKPQAARAYYVWIPASEVIWSEYTSMIGVLSDAK